jgi:hypothetical protein
MTERFEYLDGLEALVKHRVRFVLIGGVAANLLGSTTITNDLDVCYARDPDNLKRLTKALRELHARLRAPADVPFQLDSKSFEMGDSFTFVTDVGSIDVLGHPFGIPGGYEELEAAANDIELVGGIAIKVAALDDIIRMKRAAGRPKDLVEVEILGALRDEIDDQALAQHRRRRSKR